MYSVVNPSAKVGTVCFNLDTLEDRLMHIDWLKQHKPDNWRAQVEAIESLPLSCPEQDGHS